LWHFCRRQQKLLWPLLNKCPVAPDWCVVVFYAGSFVHSASDKLDNSLISAYNNYIFVARNSSCVSIGSGLGNPRQLDGALVWLVWMLQTWQRPGGNLWHKFNAVDSHQRLWPWSNVWQQR